MTLECLARSDYSYSGSNIAFVQPKRQYRDIARPVLGMNVSVAVKKLIEDWHNETLLMSSTDEMQKVESFSQIVRYGRSALPSIVDDLERKPSLLMLAAAEITGENPITEGIRGDIRAMAGAWVGWYQLAKRELF
jgi:hypothetical protein